VVADVSMGRNARSYAAGGLVRVRAFSGEVDGSRARGVLGHAPLYESPADPVTERS
jgi:hypothetical protein